MNAGASQALEEADKITIGGRPVGHRWPAIHCFAVGVSAVSATPTAPAPTVPEHRPYRHPEGFPHFPLPPRPGSIPDQPPRDAEVPARVSMGMCRSFPGTGPAGISHNIAQERQVLFDEADFLYTAKDELFRRRRAGAVRFRPGRGSAQRKPRARPQPGAPQRTSQRPIPASRSRKADTSAAITPTRPTACLSWMGVQPNSAHHELSSGASAMSIRNRSRCPHVPSSCAIPALRLRPGRLRERGRTPAIMSDRQRRGCAGNHTGQGPRLIRRAELTRSCAGRR